MFSVWQKGNLLFSLCFLISLARDMVRSKRRGLRTNHPPYYYKQDNNFSNTHNDSSKSWLTDFIYLISYVCGNIIFHLFCPNLIQLLLIKTTKKKLPFINIYFRIDQKWRLNFFEWPKGLRCLRTLTKHLSH